MDYFEHGFTANIIEILDKHFPGIAMDIFNLSPLLRYINFKTRAANRDSKARKSFGNLYALYVLIEDYINHGFHKSGKYDQYQGAQFTNLLNRQRELPFGAKLQNHALNHRLNQEYRKRFPDSELPIIREIETNRYWIKESLLIVRMNKKLFNIAESILEIIDAYADTMINELREIMNYCKKIIAIKNQPQEELAEFVIGLLKPDIDSRIFEIVSYAILKNHYAEKKMYWGWDIEQLNEEHLKLYKTGRTNANDGGIDFVMKPLGVFFQVTETIDPDKYFLDIDKVQKYPITFVVKSELPAKEIRKRIKLQAKNRYSINSIVNRYMAAVEEIINIPTLTLILNKLLQEGKGDLIVKEIITQSKYEFNLD